ncbi:choline transporter [Planomonospora parontospora subsp. parontospora]|uniref:Choline transporter n=2 Tax=Planomonospora parontospora TaxID=58119 RepID=A0AA37F5F7_9ACTN|nr:BCCT family transporter [Planomonospora parontospora]GGK73299.1 choline transporter [Planomonospora parontospora]GII09383.1 choline transporter [Planomonospora parontospora subsp. parontospora]
MRTRKPDVPLLSAAMGLLVAVVVWGAVFTESLAAAGDAALAWVLENLGWLFVLAADFFLVLAVVLALGRFGRIRLGGDDDTPEFTNLAWTAMMFSSGMGIGLMFYGVAEPVTHLLRPPPDLDLVPGSLQAARTAMEYSLFHWTLHPWAVYAVTGMALAYSTFRKGRGNQFSAAFSPLFGGTPRPNAGRALDLLAMLATVFGTATSLGLGALQVEYGLNELFGIGGRRLEVIVIIVLTAAFVVSAATGVHGGVRWLSTVNVHLAALLAVLIFVFGPTVAVLDLIPASLGGYLSDLIPMSSRTGAFMDKAWLGEWTIFYWAWWMSWAPFVGAFIARISRGRTIREFVVGVLLIPSGASLLWFAISGGSAVWLQQSGEADFTRAVAEGSEAAMFTLLDNLPLDLFTTVIAVVLVALYFVSGADAASLVLGSLSTEGSLRPPRPLVVMWGVLVGAVAMVLLLAGGLKALQQATILVSLPFVIVMLLLCAALVKELREDPGAGTAVRGQQIGLLLALRRIAGRDDGK